MINMKEVEIFNKVKENDVVTSFYMRPKSGEKLKKNMPGQFISVNPIKEGENKGAIRQYSLSMKPGLDFYRISVKREEHGLVSRYMHDEVKIGDTIFITDPLGKFTLKDSNKPLVLISGGIGVTPTMSMLYKALEDKRDVTFVQAVLNSTQHTFKNELKELKKNNKYMKTGVFYQSPLEADILGEDYDEVGFITKEWIEENLPKDGDFYFCGPLGFMKHIYDTLKEMGISNDSIHYEMFGPSKDLSKL
ncbi:nitric oxide dioxygenase [Clostridium moniliforme]|uniref:Nitric oxide dioxygenase n=1 Tax=Clostridium moniliforme TaxID=39489 RepID=A0ABS4EZ29_9CLOT|nr:FAD-binding oxidoreductase [Clostridium moniliforme]MBP1889250.1 nitric oxide dioxygenase [Clostridium moniliforme]